MIVRGSYRAGALVFPGSFNPLHEGHVAMARIASARYSVGVHPEISIANVDKPDIPDNELEKRLDQVQSLGSPLVTRAALFAEKADLFPECRFIIGADTAIRLSDSRYAGGDVSTRDEMLGQIEAVGCRFVVFGRLVAGLFRDAEELPLCDRLRSMCDFVSETEFRIDICSTDLR